MTVERGVGTAGKNTPAARLLREGASVLTPEELVRVLLGKGTRSQVNVGMGSGLQLRYGSRLLTERFNARELAAAADLSVADAVRLAAAVELGKRLFDPGSGDRPVLHTPADVYAFVCEMSRLRQEHFRCLYLNNLNRVVGDRIISIGTVNSSPVHPREVFFGAVEHSAQALILVHNHPSGNPEPSPQDLRLTNRLAAVARLFSIALLDHVIVGKHSYYSFKDHARLDSGGELSMPTES